jgi:hypothetical protein
MKRTGAYALIIGLTVCGYGIAAQSREAESHGLITPADVTWGPAPPSLPPGAQGAVLQGDPAKAGPFTLRLKLPDGFRIPPHYDELGAISRRWCPRPCFIASKRRWGGAAGRCRIV